MVIDLTLDGLKVPALTGYKTKIGTVVKETAENKGRLTAAEVADNIAMPWIRSRPIQVDSDCTLGRADYDTRIMAVTPGITITLGGASYAGCTVTVYACIDGGSVTVETGSDSKPVSAGCSAIFMWNGTAFAVSNFANTGQSTKDKDNKARGPYSNGDWAFNCMSNASVRLTAEQESILVTGTASKSAPTGHSGGAHIAVANLDKLTALTWDGDPPSLPKNMAVIKIKPNNTEQDRKTFFLLTYFVSNTAPTWAAWSCRKSKETGAFQAVSLLGFNAPDSTTGKYLSFQQDPFNRPANFSLTDQWLSFNFYLSDMEPDEEGYIYIGLTTSVGSGNICCWATADRNTDRIIMNARSFVYGISGGSGAGGAFSSNTVLDSFSYTSVGKILMVPIDKNHRDILVGFATRAYPEILPCISWFFKNKGILDKNPPYPCIPIFTDVGINHQLPKIGVFIPSDIVDKYVVQIQGCYFLPLRADSIATKEVFLIYWCWTESV